MTVLFFFITSVWKLFPARDFSRNPIHPHVPTQGRGLVQQQGKSAAPFIQRLRIYFKQMTTQMCAHVFAGYF